MDNPNNHMGNTYSTSVLINNFKKLLLLSLAGGFTVLVFLNVYLVQKTKPTVESSAANFQGDVDGNGIVNILDFQLLSNSFGRSQGQTGYDARCDFDGSNSVNILDFQVLSNNFGKTGVA